MRINHLDPPREVTILEAPVTIYDTARWLSELREKAEAFRVAMIDGGHVAGRIEMDALRGLEGALQPLNYRKG